MYALHEAGLAVSALPPPQPVSPPGQLEQRALEETERGSLRDESRFGALYSPTSAILQLVEGSAQRFTELLEVSEDAKDAETLTGSSSGADPGAGQQVDVYA